MALTNEQTYLYREVTKSATAPREELAFVSFRVESSPTSSRTASFEPEPSSALVISPADAVRRYWRWDQMPETMRRLA
jgi:hypothetical protein